MEDAEDLHAYRAAARAWLAEHAPPGWKRELSHTSPSELIRQHRARLRELHSGGYAVPHWPVEWGGADAPLERQIVLYEEMAAVRAPFPDLYTVSIYHAALTIIAHGSEEQKRRHLPAILEGQIWCQGFSEPGAGSDLAGLSTRAVRRGDHYIVNGQKVWSSYAEYADWCILLARTDPRAPKRRGISFFLMDMRSEGIAVRPIRQITGHREFCEIFLTDVAVPAEGLLGVENDGWKIAQVTLATERGLLLIGMVEQLRRAAAALVELARDRGLVADAGIRREIARFHAESEVLALMCARLLRDVARKGGVGPEASIVKVAYSELLQRMTDFGVSLSGLRAHIAAETPGLFDIGTGAWLIDHLGSWAWTIAAGTNEIQRTLIGERMLGLPREPTPA